MEKELIKSPDMTQQKPLYNNVRYYITRVRAHVCVCARRPVNFCTNCTNGAWIFIFDFHAAQLCQMEGGAYVYVVVSGLQRVAE